MSLDWRVNEIKDFETKCWVKNGKTKDGQPLWDLNFVTETIIWSMMAIDMNKITEKNKYQVYVRLATYEAVSGIQMMKDGKPRPLTLRDVEDHVGLYTNVTQKTDAQFMKRMIERAKSREWGL